jgi:putative NIF3 family GTP cyclohydrolase 1 type 2
VNLEQFESYIKKLFNKELLKEFDDDYGFTNKSNNSISTIGYTTNLSIETIEKAVESKVDLMITHHDAWDFIISRQKTPTSRNEKGVAQ